MKRKECSRQRPWHILSHGCEGSWLAQGTEKKLWGEMVRMSSSWRILWAMFRLQVEDMRCHRRVLSSKVTSYFTIRKIILNTEWIVSWRLEVGSCGSDMSWCWMVLTWCQLEWMLELIGIIDWLVCRLKEESRMNDSLLACQLSPCGAVLWDKEPWPKWKVQVWICRVCRAYKMAKWGFR